MKRPVARPHKVPAISFFELEIAGFGKTKTLPWPFAPAHIYGSRWPEIQIVGMEAKNSQDPRETCEIAVDNLFQIRNPSMPPVTEAIVCEQTHSHQYIDRSHDVALFENGSYRALDSGIEHIATVVACGDSRSLHQYKLCPPSVGELIVIFIIKFIVY